MKQSLERDIGSPATAAFFAVPALKNPNSAHIHLQERTIAAGTDIACAGGMEILANIGGNRGELRNVGLGLSSPNRLRHGVPAARFQTNEAVHGAPAAVWQGGGGALMIQAGLG
jgi:hypothetical protein